MKKSELKQLIREEIQKEGLFGSSTASKWKKWQKEKGMDDKAMDDLAYELGYGSKGNLTRRPIEWSFKGKEQKLKSLGIII